MSETETDREPIADDIAFLSDLSEGYDPVRYEAALDRVVDRLQHLTQALEERDGWLYAAQEFYRAWSANNGVGFVQETEAFRQAMLEASRALTPTTPEEGTTDDGRNRQDELGRLG